MILHESFDIKNHIKSNIHASDSCLRFGCGIASRALPIVLKGEKSHNRTQWGSSDATRKMAYFSQHMFKYSTVPAPAAVTADRYKNRFFLSLLSSHLSLSLCSMYCWIITVQAGCCGGGGAGDCTSPAVVCRGAERSNRKNWWGGVLCHRRGLRPKTRGIKFTSQIISCRQFGTLVSHVH